MGSTANSICAGLVVDQENNPIITGQLYGTNADVDPGSGVLNLSSAGNNDCFIIKYTSDGLLWMNDPTTGDIGNPPTADYNDILVYPNPASDRITIKGLTVHEPCPFVIFDATGRPCLSGALTTQTIDISRLSDGFYYLLIDNQQLARKYKFRVVQNKMN